MFYNCSESNEVLKNKFNSLHVTVVDNVNPASVINFLFEKKVIGANDMRSLQKFRDDPQQQSSELLALLHTSQHPQAFIHLYAAIQEELHLRWLIERIDKCSLQSLTSQLQQMRIVEPTGEGNNVIYTVVYRNVPVFIRLYLWLVLCSFYGRRYYILPMCYVYCRTSYLPHFPAHIREKYIRAGSFTVAFFYKFTHTFHPSLL